MCPTHLVRSFSLSKYMRARYILFTIVGERVSGHICNLAMMGCVVALNTFKYAHMATNHLPDNSVSSIDERRKKKEEERRMKKKEEVPTATETFQQTSAQSSY